MEHAISVYLSYFYEHAVFYYCVALFGLYALLTCLSRMIIQRWRFLTAFRNDDTLLTSPITPGISIIAPAYNESVIIIANVRSLLTLNYPLFEVIIVNDGSTDDTLEKLIREFSLVQVDFADPGHLKTMPVRAYYKSTKKAYNRLLIVDKENGKAKADAVNAGLNLAHYPYFLNTDVDSILDNDTLIKLIQPILEEKREVIAVGASLRIANSCQVDSGMLTRVRPPRKWIPAFQEIEYTRSFSMGKLGWSYLNAVPNVSGGLGLFNREVVMQAGGYDPRSYAEDMDVIFRMSRYMCEQKRPYAIRYIPQTLCWTEGPNNLKVLYRQRLRWARGLWQVIGMHFGTLFNPKYKRLGWIVLPYNLIFELLAPIVELTGIAYYIYIVITGQINWFYAIILLVFVYAFSLFITLTSLLWDQLIYRQYKTWKEICVLGARAFLEPFIYHPILLFSSIVGYIQQLLGMQNNWGKMDRKGFESTPEKENNEPQK